MIGKTSSLLLLALCSTLAVSQTPNHRPGAPFRAKLSPPHAEGSVLVVRGRVTDAASGEGVARAVLDAFQADALGRYDTDGFDYRARLVTDERGRFEFETIVPSNYGPAPHIHFIVTADGYSERSTEMFFRDEQHPKGGAPELTPELAERKTKSGKRYFEARFDVTLTRAR